MKKLCVLVLAFSSSVFAQQTNLSCGSAVNVVKQYVQTAQDSIDQAQKTNKNNQLILIGHANYFAAQALLKFACPQYTKAIDALEESIKLIEQAVAQP